VRYLRFLAVAVLEHGEPQMTQMTQMKKQKRSVFDRR
jgi:hypothetical protein